LTRSVASVVKAQERSNGTCVPQSQADGRACTGFGGFRSVSSLENLSFLIPRRCYSWSGEFVGDMVGEDLAGEEVGGLVGEEVADLVEGEVGFLVGDRVGRSDGNMVGF
jgi:hypothetical protein